MEEKKMGQQIAGLWCEEIAAQLSAYYDKEIIDEELCRRIEEHVGRCENCTAVLHTFNKTIELYKTQEAGGELSDETRRKLHVVLHIEDLIDKSK